MKLTTNQLNVINDVVLDAQAWADNAADRLGVEKGEMAMLEKVARYQEAYNTRLSKGNYKNRVERDLDEEQAMVTRWSPDLASAKIKRKQELKDKVRNLIATRCDWAVARENNPDDGTSVPQEIRTHYAELKATYQAAKIEIDALTTSKDVKKYYAKWPDEPEI